MPSTITVVTQPMSLIVSQGTTVTFNVSGTSSAPLDVVNYRWLKSTDGTTYNAVGGALGTFSRTNTAYSFTAGILDTNTFYKTLTKIHIGKLPIMLKSNICALTQYKHVENTYTGECKFDTGGYFIINGSEKTVLGQERAAENKVYDIVAATLYLFLS